jgi:phage tail-like protein
MMDSNQTRFHLVLGKDDWARYATAGGSGIFQTATDVGPAFSWNVARSELTLGKRVNLFPSAPANQVPTIDQRRGAGQDRFGNWYFIAGLNDELLVTSSGTSATTHFWSSQDELGRACLTEDGAFQAVAPATTSDPLIFSGLAVTERHYLVVGVRQPAGFIVFDLFHGGPPRQYVWPRTIPFDPFDISPAPGGGVWILDRTNRRLWALDRNFAVLRQDQASIDVSPAQTVFSPSDSSAGLPHAHKVFPAGISLDMGSPLGSIDAIAIEVLPDGTVLLLESNPSPGFSNIYRMRYGVPVGNPVSLSIVLSTLAPADQKGFTLLGFDFAFIPTEPTPGGQRNNTLYVVAPSGDQAWAFTADYSTDQLALTPLEEFYPMRLFGGRGIVRGATQVYYDSQDRFVPLIVQRRPRYADSGSLVTKPFDGHQPDTVWHRLLLDASIPPDTDVTVFSRAHNDPTVLLAQPWNEEPGPYRRRTGSELPWTPNPPCLDTWELLFQKATGQYLQLQLMLSGNGRLTPSIRALRAYYPRFSYRDHYLPGVYREEPASASFVDRFLANFEGFYTEIEDRIAAVQTLFDASTAPSETLDWLANWFGVALDPSWTDAKRRLFLLNAPTFFESRGTLPGLMMALRLTLEDCADADIFTNPISPAGGPRLVEKFRTRSLPFGMLQDAPAETGLPAKPQTTVWTPAQGADDLDQRYIKSLKQPDGTRYPIAIATTDPNFGAWRTFSMATLGFVPGAPDDVSDLWPNFLRGRYGVIDNLNTAYGTSYSGFDDVPFPSDLPRKPQPLLDWYQSQGALLVQDSAHQFTVFLPMPLGDAQNTEAHRAKLDLAQRVVALEKPAHTTFEIKFYWAFFRVGEARLEADTLLDFGSRAPQLLRPAVLNDTYIGSAYPSRQQPGDPRMRPLFKPRSC